MATNIDTHMTGLCRWACSQYDLHRCVPQQYDTYIGLVTILWTHWLILLYINWFTIWYIHRFTLLLTRWLTLLYINWSTLWYTHWFNYTVVNPLVMLYINWTNKWHTLWFTRLCNNWFTLLVHIVMHQLIHTAMIQPIVLKKPDDQDPHCYIFVSY